jgi:class 3 adenylate cyclase
VFLFTDVVGSTELKSRVGTPGYARVLARHNDLFESLAGQFSGGEILKHTGDGYFAAFSTASDAVRFALLFQHGMRTLDWDGTPLTTRVGIHIGEVAVVQMAGDDDVVGLAADLAARVKSLATGGQILLTQEAFNSARQFNSEHPGSQRDALRRSEIVEPAADDPRRAVVERAVVPAEAASAPAAAEGTGDGSSDAASESSRRGVAGPRRARPPYLRLVE